MIQDIINRTISENISELTIGKARLKYNGTEDCAINKIDTVFEDYIHEALTEADDFKEYRGLSAGVRRSMIFEALEVVSASQQVKDFEEASSQEPLLDCLELFVVKSNSDRNNHVRVWNDETQEFDWDYHSLKTILGEKYLAMLPKYPCLEVYDPMIPHDSPRIVRGDEDGQNGIASINMYKHPSWRIDSPLCLNDPKSEKVQLELPESARMFFEHLFPEEESRNYVFRYLYHAMTNRNGCEPILVLHGRQGTGKTIFCSALMVGLFGESNWGAASKNFFNSSFNPVLVNKRIVFIDEADVDHKRYNTVKLYANDHVNIERKGFDANNNTELFFSFLVSTNNMGNYYIHHDDRRNSIVNTTDVKLLDAWSKSDIDKFAKELRDPSGSLSKGIGEYILSKSWLEDDEDEEIFQFKQDKYYEFVHRHLSSWQKKLITQIEKAGSRGLDSITLDSILMKIENDGRVKFPPQEVTIIEFVENYTHLGEHPLGEISQDDEGSNILVINEAFFKELSEESEGEDLL